jgi:hypothetical protein
MKPAVQVLSAGGAGRDNRSLRRSCRQPAWFPWLRTWRVCPAAGALLAAVLTGCGSERPASSPNGTGRPETRAPGRAVAAAAHGLSSNNVSAVPKSVFRVNLPSGRDPFFPESSANLADSGAGAAVSRWPLVSYLKLAGIRPGKARPLALINRTTFAPGEEEDVSIVVSNQLSQAEVEKISIRCLEIRRDSVLISIAGEEGVKELRMAQTR